MSETNQKKEQATRAEVLDWIYNQMQAGKTFAVANEESKERFEIIKCSEKKGEGNGEVGTNGT